MQVILQAAALAPVRAREDTAQRLVERDESQIQVPSLEAICAEIARLLGSMR